MLKMSCQNLCRRYLHLVRSEGGGMYSLRHMDMSKLFYPSTGEALDAEAQAKMKKKTGISKLRISRLPTPSIHYQSFLPIEPDRSIGVLALLGKSKNKILFSDEAGNTSIYNTELRSLTATPILNSPKDSYCVAVSIPGAAAARAMPDSDDHSDNLFMLDMHRRTCCFEVLGCDSMVKWRWSVLPPPPFLEDREYEVPLMTDFTVVDNTKICVSTTTATYSFDTVTHEWNKVGDWVLPFRAEYIPELGLWLGLLPDSGPYDLCTLDNLSTVAGSPPPTMQHIGEEESELPESWSESQLVHDLVNLGSGRFCIANKFILNFGEVKYPWIPMTVFTGVEVLPGERGLHMVKHKSKRFRTEFESVF